MKRIKMVLAVTAIFGTTLVGAVHATSMSLDTNTVAREASEGTRGFDNEKPGDKHRGRTKAYEQFDQVAREASEGTRGFDNEKPGDKHRGRVKAIEQFDQLARESTELPSGKDNERPGDRQRRGGRHA